MNRNIITAADVQAQVKRAQEARRADVAESAEADRVGVAVAPPVAEPVTSVPKETADGYLDQLTKYVPMEVIGAYIVVEGLLDGLLKGSTALPWCLLALLVLGIVATWFYTQSVLGVVRESQRIMSTLAFLAWAFATGGWFATLTFWAPAWGTIAVVVFAVLVKIVKVSPLPAPATTN